MQPIVEINEEGAIYLPTEILTSIKPHTRFLAELQNGTIILRPEDQFSEPKHQPFWATAMPEEQAERLMQWVHSRREGPGLPDEALRRENMYD